MNRFFQKMYTDHKLGLRIVKTGIAVTICIVISNLLKLNQPLLAVIATVLSMGKSVDVSVRSGRNKMVGVLIGSALGCGSAMISPANAGLCGVGIIVVLYLCQLLRLGDAGTLSCFAFAAVMFFPPSQKPWNYAITCGVNALIGIGVAVVVNLIVFPPNYAEEIRRTYDVLREKTDLAIQDASERHVFDVAEIETIIGRLSSQVRLYVSETKFLRSDDDEVFSISCRVSSYRLILDELKAIDAMDLAENDEIPDDMQTVYKYHINRMQCLRKNIDAPQDMEKPQK